MDDWVREINFFDGSCLEDVEIGGDILNMWVILFFCYFVSFSVMKCGLVF